MQTLDFIQEAENLARKCLNEKCLELFKEARVLGNTRNKKLTFFFENQAGLILFQKDKEELLKRLRIEYKKQQSLYKQVGFIFYGIEAKSMSEIKHRDNQSLKTLEKGIARLSSILEKTREEKRYGLSA